MHELSFVGLGGPQPARWHGPRAARCVIAIAPALGLRADYYGVLADALVTAGGGELAVVTLDLPGHGKSPVRAGRASDWGYAEITAHLAGVRAAVRAESRASFVWLGHSIGGQIALMDAEHADGVVLVASSAPYFRAWRGLARGRILLGTQLIAVLGRVVGHYPGEALRFGGREARSLMAQWARVARTGRYVFGAFDGDAAIARVSAPVLALTIEGDDLAHVAAVEHTLAKLGSTRITRCGWGRDAQGELARGNQHNRWPRVPAFAVAQVMSFLRRERLVATPDLERIAS